MTQDGPDSAGIPQEIGSVRCSGQVRRRPHSRHTVLKGSEDRRTCDGLNPAGRSAERCSPGALWRQTATVRIGTWNLAGRWDARHLALIETMDCDVLLLTEVSECVELPGYDLHLGGLSMMPKRRWAAVASRLPMRPMPDPHGASAMAELEGLRVCSTILPWRSCGTKNLGGCHHRGEDHPPLPQWKPPPPWSGAETGTMPCQAGIGPARSRAVGPCSSRSSGWDSRCPQQFRHTRSRISSASTTSPSPSPGRSARRNGIEPSSERAGSPTTTRTWSNLPAPAPMTKRIGTCSGHSRSDA